jgi:hypothetical protein
VFRLLPLSSRIGGFMWIPVLLRKFADMLHAETDTIQEKLAEHERSARNRSETSKQQEREVGTIIAGAIETASNAIPAYKYTKHDKEYSLQRKMLWVTFGGGLAASVAAGGALYYACIAKGQLDQMIEATRQARRSADTAASTLRENQKQFRDTLSQMKEQTGAQQDAAAAAKNSAAVAQKTLSVNLSAILAAKGVPRIVVDPWVAWYYGSIWCKAGKVCTRLTIHNIVRETEATGLQIAVKIQIRPTVPATYPHNFFPVAQSRLGFSPLVAEVAPGYPNCVGCSSFLAQQTLPRKAGTVYVWGVVRYYIFGSDEIQTSPFCFQATSDEIFRIASGRDGFGNADDSHTCHINQAQPFPKP